MRVTRRYDGRAVQDAPDGRQGGTAPNQARRTFQPFHATSWAFRPQDLPAAEGAYGLCKAMIRDDTRDAVYARKP